VGEISSLLEKEEEGRIAWRGEAFFGRAIFEHKDLREHKWVTEGVNSRPGVKRTKSAGQKKD